MPLPINNTFPFVRNEGVNGPQSAIQKGFQRLSSGFRINQAADDASGLAISENLRALTRSMTAAERNTNNAISMVQTAEGGMSQVGELMGRMRELAVQSADGSLTATDRDMLDTEFQQLQTEIDRLTESTEFNGKELLAGNPENIDFQVGENTAAADVISVQFGGMGVSSLGLTGANITGADNTNSYAAINSLDAAMQQLNERRAEFGAAQNRLSYSVANTQTQRVNVSAANSRIRDADFAEETSNLARNQVLLQSRTSVQLQANQQSAMALLLLK